MYVTIILRVIIVMDTIFLILVNGFLDCNLVEGYFKEKRTKYAIVIGCFSKQVQLATVKYFVFKRPISVLNINRINVTESLINKYYHIGVAVDGDCHNVQDVLRNIGTYNLYDVRHHWLVLCSRKSCIEMFENVALYVNADVQVVYPERNVNGSISNYTVEAVYNPSYERNGTLKHYTIGFYNEVAGYNAREGPKYWIRRNMTGIVLRTSAVLTFGFEGNFMDYLHSEKHKENDTFNRYHYKIMDVCKQYYNFTSNVSLTKSWGYESENHTFDGEMGEMQRKTIDYGSGPLMLRANRIPVVDFGRVTWNLRTSFIFRNTKSSRNSIDSFIRPLSSLVWILIICITMVIILVLKLSYCYERKHVQQDIDVSWSHLVLICLTGAFCQQGMLTTPSLFSGRIAMLFMFLFSLLIYQFYSASLVSDLLIEPDTKIKTLEDLVKSDMRAGCQDTLYNRDYFIRTKNKPSIELYYKKILGKNNNSNFLPVDDGLNFVRKGGYAFFVEFSSAFPRISKTFEDKAICEIKMVKMHRTRPTHSAYQKHSPYREMFEACVQYLAENGIMSRELTFWHPAKPKCIGTSGTTLNSIGMDDFYPVWGILAIGILSSFLILTFEIVIHRKVLWRHHGDNTAVIHPFIQ